MLIEKVSFEFMLKLLGVDFLSFEVVYPSPIAFYKALTNV
jgi:hypothetical protein